MVVQLLLLRKASTLPNSDWEAFMKLQHHLDDFEKSVESQTTQESIQLMSKAAKEYSGTQEQLDLIESMTGRLLINTLTLVAPTYEPLGLCLDPVAALMNHSCNPNAVVSFNGSCLSIRALSPIPKDTEIMISYIDITNPIPMRQTELQTRYFFTCVCPECANGNTLGKPDIPSTLAAALPPLKLQELESKGFGLRFDAQQKASTTDALALLDEGLALFAPYKTVYPIYRQPRAHLVQKSILIALNAGRWVKAFTHSVVVYFHIDPILFPQPYHPLRVVHKWILVKLMQHLSALWMEGEPSVQAFAEKYELNFAVVIWGLLQEVVGNVGKSHGEDSRFGATVKRKLEEFKVDMGGLAEEIEKAELASEWKKLRKVAADVVK
ncbi:hypothetical protein MMC06_000419 [Schaereria dolodes]|nr:hypothetical protein [Schaereria dolodes]